MTRDQEERNRLHVACGWVQAEAGIWETGCGELHMFCDGTPTENEYKFCPYCGRTLSEQQPAAEADR